MLESNVEPARPSTGFRPREAAARDQIALPRPIAPAQTFRQWQRRYATALVAMDLVVAVLASVLAAVLSPGESGAYVHGLPFSVVMGGVASAWVLFLLMSGGYEYRFLGAGADEYKRVSEAALRFAAVGAVVIYLAEAVVARGFALGLIPALWFLTFFGRWVCRKVLHAQRRRGRCMRRVLIVGPRSVAAAMEARMARDQYAGYGVVASFDWDGRDASLPAVSRAVQRHGADTIAVPSGPPFSPGSLRRLARHIEGTGPELLVDPALTNIAGSRVHIRPVAGLPLLHVEEPNLSGISYLAKHALDRLVALALLIALAPLLFLLAALIRLTSPGPALFVQERLGKDGQRFRIYKFRTMYDGADAQFARLVEASGTDHGMFVKQRHDPRTTPIGRWLRRLSIDELPQLMNVVRGEMSLVGPRPLPAVVAQDEDARRRLLVRPGITGLWQVSGRSELPWEEALRIDLYYVENWSLSFDLMIMWRTFRAVLVGTGAY